jgi:hypothetical protein
LAAAVGVVLPRRAERLEVLVVVLLAVIFVQEQLYSFAVVLLEEGVFVRFRCEGRGHIYSVILLELCTHIINFFLPTI